MKEITYFPQDLIYDRDSEINRIFYVINGGIKSYNLKKDVKNCLHFEKFQKGDTFCANNFFGRT